MSLSREFASFVVGLRYEDLPPEVIDRAKGVTLQARAARQRGYRRRYEIRDEIPVPTRRVTKFVTKFRSSVRRTRDETGFVSCRPRPSGGASSSRTHNRALQPSVHGFAGADRSGEFASASSASVLPFVFNRLARTVGHCHLLRRSQVGTRRNLFRPASGGRSIGISLRISLRPAEA
jgi:hypothetical protein